jgi:hypothetical protein
MAARLARPKISTAYPLKLLFIKWASAITPATVPHLSANIASALGCME